MGCKPTLPPPQIDPCLVKPTCFFWGGVSRWMRARSRSLAWSCVCFECCGLRHRGCRLEFRLTAGPADCLGWESLPPPAPPGLSCLVECGVCPSASGPCWGLRLESGPQRHGVASGLAHLSMGFTPRIRRSASLHWPLAGGPLKSRAFAYPAAHRPFATALPGALRAGARAQ